MQSYQVQLRSRKNNGLQHKALLVCLYNALNTRGSDAYSAI